MKTRKGYRVINVKLESEIINCLIVHNFLVHIGTADISKYNISYVKNGYFTRILDLDFDTEDDAIDYILRELNLKFKDLSGTTPEE